MTSQILEMQDQADLIGADWITWSKAAGILAKTLPASPNRHLQAESQLNQLKDHGHLTTSRGKAAGSIYVRRAVAS